MTDNLPARDNREEIKLPVIMCPFCGEKDPHKLAIHSVTRDYDLENIAWTWIGHHEEIIAPTHQNSKITIEGQCISCFTSFEIIISARRPYYRNKYTASRV